MQIQLQDTALIKVGQGFWDRCVTTSYALTRARGNMGWLEVEAAMNVMHHIRL